MSLLSPLMVKQEYTNTDLSLEAKAGKSLLIWDIRIVTPTGNHATLKIGKTTVGYFRTAGNLGNHLGMGKGSASHSHSVTVAAADGALTEDHALSTAYGIANANLAIYSDLAALTTVPDMVGFSDFPHAAYETILAYLRRKGVFNGYPVGEGETFTITGVKAAGCFQQVLYSEFDAGDMLPSMPNGSESDEYLLFNYGRVAAAITTSVDTIFSVVQTPAEFPDFPYGKDVPAKTEIDLIGILASDIVDDRGGTDDMSSSYLKLIRQRETLFDDDKNGLFMRGIIGNTDAAAVIGKGISMLGNYSDKDLRPPIMFDPFITFMAGEELGIYLTTVAGAGRAASTLAVADTEICLIERVRKVA